jgi:hypothetical protein|tara:strand:- start:192 stop:416 length:225 start_codon:yes stop_codon:yes gene_type:complete
MLGDPATLKNQASCLLLDGGLFFVLFVLHTYSYPPKRSNSMEGFMTMQDLVDTGVFLGVSIYAILLLACWFLRP